MTFPLPPSTLLDQASLYLDFDGTLVEFASTPDGVAVGTALRATLAALARRLDGRVAVVSGRGLDDLARRLAVDGIALAGSHGLERRDGSGRVYRAAPPDDLDELIGEAHGFAARHGVLVEIKPYGVALHFRARPDAAAAVDDFARVLAADHAMIVQPGSMVRELRPAGADKGDVVRAFQAEPPFGSGRPVFVGDDLTDEHGFAAAAALDGAGVLVGAERVSEARYHLPSVAAVMSWLKG